MEERIMPHLAVLPPQHQRYLTASRQFLPPAPALSHATTTGINRPRSSQQSFLAKSANDAISLNAPALLSLSTRPSPATSTNKQIYMLRPQVRATNTLLVCLIGNNHMLRVLETERICGNTHSQEGPGHGQGQTRKIAANGSWKT